MKPSNFSLSLSLSLYLSFSFVSWILSGEKLKFNAMFIYAFYIVISYYAQARLLEIMNFIGNPQINFLLLCKEIDKRDDCSDLRIMNYYPSIRIVLVRRLHHFDAY